MEIVLSFMGLVSLFAQVEQLLCLYYISVQKLYSDIPLFNLFKYEHIVSTCQMSQ